MHTISILSIFVAPSLFDDLPPESENTKNGNNKITLGKRKSLDCEDDDSTSDEVKQPKLSNHCKLKGYIGERRGEREDMQDAHTIINDFTPQFPALPNNMYVRGVCICLQQFCIRNTVYIYMHV